MNIGPKDAAFINNVAKSAEQYQLPTVEYNNEQLHQRWPVFNFDSDYKAIFESKAGYLNSENAIRTYVKLGRQNGVSQDFNAKVRSINDSKGMVTIQTDQTTYYAKHAIVAAGTWVKELLPDLPIQPTRKVFAWFNINNDSLNESTGFPAFTVEIKNGSTFYGFPASNHTIKIGKHDGGQSINQRSARTKYGSYSEDTVEIAPLLDNHLTGTNGIDHGAACTYDQSPDGDFIIDQLPGHSNIQIVSGLSGHGFKFASGLGQLLAQQALGESTDFDLTPFRLNRFNS